MKVQKLGPGFKKSDIEAEIASLTRLSQLAPFTAQQAIPLGQFASPAHFNTEKGQGGADTTSSRASTANRRGSLTAITGNLVGNLGLGNIRTSTTAGSGT